MRSISLRASVAAPSFQYKHQERHHTRVTLTYPASSSSINATSLKR